MDSSRIKRIKNVGGDKHPPPLTPSIKGEVKGEP